MLTIRKEQINVFAERGLDSFEEEMVSYLKGSFSEECDKLDALTLRQTVRYGIKRAQIHGFETSGQIQRWLAIMFTFGRDFDSKGECAWALRILNGSGSTSEKMDRLFAEALGYEADGLGLGFVPGSSD